MPFEYNSNYRKETTQKLIKDIWFVDERDIELAFSDVDDDYNVDMLLWYSFSFYKQHLTQNDF